MHNYIFLNEEISFPHQSYADSDGLLAIGGDLSLERLELAYANGIFPWYEEGQPILWWSPDPRFVLFTKNFKLTSKQEKIIHKSNFLITENLCFQDVISFCANVKRKTQEDENATWITSDMQQAYYALHQHDIAHSIEIWHTQKPNTPHLVTHNYENQNYYLVGGLYGILTKNIFCGKSMFSLMPEASRCALKYLVTKLKQHDIPLIDCQVESPHFLRMGASFISREEYLRILYQ